MFHKKVRGFSAQLLNPLWPRVYGLYTWSLCHPSCSIDGLNAGLPGNRIVLPCRLNGATDVPRLNVLAGNHDAQEVGLGAAGHGTLAPLLRCSFWRNVQPAIVFEEVRINTLYNVR